MASVANPSLTHRSVSSIRTGGLGVTGGGGGAGGGGATTPTTPGGPATSGSPYRSSSAYASPSALRAEEDTIVLEVGARKLAVGFAGDAQCRGTMVFGPEQQRRVGDLRVWQDGYRRDWRGAAGEGGQGQPGRENGSSSWDRPYELWQLDVREMDAGLISDKLERALREALTRLLLIDSRPRRMAAVLPSGLPIPLVAATLDTLFGRFQAPSVALMSVPVAAAAAAGLRSALVVDLGWAETAVTSVYEYREVATTRTMRAGRMLVRKVHDLLASQLPGRQADAQYHLSFEECEDVTARLVWCRPGRPVPRLAKRDSRSTEGSSSLPTVTETDEAAGDDIGDVDMLDLDARPLPPLPLPPPPENRVVDVPLASCAPPATVHLSFDQLAAPCDDTFFGGPPDVAADALPASWDDDELPLPLLVYRHLLRLPVDVRARCMGRILFVGGGTRILGLRGRIFHDVARLVAAHGWDGVRGRGIGQFRDNQKLKRRKSANSSASAASADVWHDAANAVPEPDPIEEEMRKMRIRNGDDSVTAAGAAVATPAGELRAVETLGPWTGASLLAQLRVPILAAVDREQWLQQGGAAGAARPGDVDVKNLQRHSIIGGAGGSGSNTAGSASLRNVPGAGSSSSASASASWTLGAWGVW